MEARLRGLAGKLEAGRYEIIGGMSNSEIVDILSKGLFYHMIKPLENQILHRADLVLATSPIYAEYSPQLRKVRNKVRVLPNGVMTDDLSLRPGDEKRIAKIRQTYNGRPLVLFVGRHIPYKGIEHLIRAERYIKQDVQILIAGTGPATEYYRRMAMESDRITFLGRLSTNDVRCHLWAADIFAFPSVSKAEAFGGGCCGVCTGRGHVGDRHKTARAVCPRSQVSC